MQPGDEAADADLALSGHRAAPLRGSPFARNAPAIGIAIAYGLAGAGWSPTSSRWAC